MTIELADLPEIAGGPPPIGEPILLEEDGDFRVYGTELAIMWRWDLFEGDTHRHTGCAQRPESCVVAARGKIGLFRRPDVARLLDRDA
jgi:hypothetical protein